MTPATTTAPKTTIDEAMEPVYLSVLLNRLKQHVSDRSNYERTRYHPRVRFSVPKLAAKMGMKVYTVKKWFFEPKVTALQRWYNFDKVLWALDMEITNLLTPCDLARAYFNLDKNQRVEFRLWLERQGADRPSDENIPK